MYVEQEGPVGPTMQLSAHAQNASSSTMTQYCPPAPLLTSSSACLVSIQVNQVGFR